MPVPKGIVTYQDLETQDRVDASIVVPEPPAFEFIPLNGFLYRGNRITGEMWRLEVSSTDKKAQVWKKIEDTVAAH